jgi:hypothetical protein
MLPIGKNAPRGPSRLIFWVMWDSVHKTADMPIKMKFISVPEPFTVLNSQRYSRDKASEDMTEHMGCKQMFNGNSQYFVQGDKHAFIKKRWRQYQQAGFRFHGSGETTGNRE